MNIPWRKAGLLFAVLLVVPLTITGIALAAPQRPAGGVECHDDGSGLRDNGKTIQGFGRVTCDGAVYIELDVLVVDQAKRRAVAAADKTCSPATECEKRTVATVKRRGVDYCLVAVGHYATFRNGKAYQSVDYRGADSCHF